MSEENKLFALQAELARRGVKDVKFFFGAISEKTLTDVASDVAEALQAVVDGKFSPMQPLNDAGEQRAKAAR